MLAVCHGQIDQGAVRANSWQVGHDGPLRVCSQGFGLLNDHGGYIWRPGQAQRGGLNWSHCQCGRGIDGDTASVRRTGGAHRCRDLP